MSAEYRRLVSVNTYDSNQHSDFNIEVATWYLVFGISLPGCSLLFQRLNKVINTDGGKCKCLGGAFCTQADS
jgi:hypothetical protein